MALAHSVSFASSEALTRPTREPMPTRTQQLGLLILLFVFIVYVLIRTG